jgi:hypothetical protein
LRQRRTSQAREEIGSHADRTACLQWSFAVGFSTGQLVQQSLNRINERLPQNFFVRLRDCGALDRDSVGVFFFEWTATILNDLVAQRFAQLGILQYMCIDVVLELIRETKGDGHELVWIACENPKCEAR